MYFSFDFIIKIVSKNVLILFWAYLQLLVFLSFPLPTFRHWIIVLFCLSALMNQTGHFSLKARDGPRWSRRGPGDMFQDLPSREPYPFPFFYTNSSSSHLRPLSALWLASIAEHSQGPLKTVGSWRFQIGSIKAKNRLQELCCRVLQNHYAAGENPSA